MFGVMMTNGDFKILGVENAGNAFSICGNDCGWEGSASETHDINDYYLVPGDETPAGRCPECGGLAFLQKSLRAHYSRTSFLKIGETGEITLTTQAKKTRGNNIEIKIDISDIKLPDDLIGQRPPKIFIRSNKPYGLATVKRQPTNDGQYDLFGFDSQ